MLCGPETSTITLHSIAATTSSISHTGSPKCAHWDSRVSIICKTDVNMVPNLTTPFFFTTTHAKATISTSSLPSLPSTVPESRFPSEDPASGWKRATTCPSCAHFVDQIKSNWLLCVPHRFGTQALAAQVKRPTLG